MLRPEEDLAFYKGRWKGLQGAGIIYCGREEEEGCGKKISQHTDDDKKRLW